MTVPAQAEPTDGSMYQRIGAAAVVSAVVDWLAVHADPWGPTASAQLRPGRPGHAEAAHGGAAVADPRRAEALRRARSDRGTPAAGHHGPALKAGWQLPAGLALAVRAPHDVINAVNRRPVTSCNWER